MRVFDLLRVYEPCLREDLRDDLAGGARARLYRKVWSRLMLDARTGVQRAESACSLGCKSIARRSWRSGCQSYGETIHIRILQNT